MGLMWNPAFCYRGLQGQDLYCRYLKCILQRRGSEACANSCRSTLPDPQGSEGYTPLLPEPFIKQRELKAGQD